MTEMQTYDTRQPGTTKVFFKVNDGAVASVIIGNRAVSTDSGYQFYVDDYVADQIDKCEIYLDGLTPKLKLKEGEILEVPEKSEKEKEIERLEYELERLKNAE
ncbi:hypothetical protein [Oceanobacillus sp. FSL H7-0719]|uniref:hypothetical protein n=1 Tax=Oceanobacillus sp. FSL H7-0719 TaxID=2954507 RepID=UPI0032532C85